MHWFALYVLSRHEKKVAEKLQSNNIEVYFPQKKVRKIRSDRKIWVEEPVIKSYLFIRTKYPSNDFYDVIKVPGAIKYIFFEGKPAVIPDYQIESIKVMLENNLKPKVKAAFITPGTFVEITEGPLKGHKGEVVSRRGKLNFFINLSSINASISVIIERDSFKILKKE